MSNTVNLPDEMNYSDNPKLRPKVEALAQAMSMAGFSYHPEIRSFRAPNGRMIIKLGNLKGIFRLTTVSANGLSYTSIHHFEDFPADASFMLIFLNTLARHTNR